MLNTAILFVKNSVELILIYIVWIIIHYIAGILYSIYCTPNTFIGFLISPFLVLTPHCRAFRWIIYNGGLIITDIWIVLGTWMTTKLCKKILTPLRNDN
jgi:hypothetical protein